MCVHVHNYVLSAPDYLCWKDGRIPDVSAYNELDYKMQMNYIGSPSQHPHIMRDYTNEKFSSDLLS